MFDLAMGNLYNACTASSSFGPQCDVTQGNLCTGSAVCVDGFCH